LLRHDGLLQELSHIPKFAPVPERDAVMVITTHASPSPAAEYTLLRRRQKWAAKASSQNRSKRSFGPRVFGAALGARSVPSRICALQQNRFTHVSKGGTGAFRHVDALTLLTLTAFKSQ
jgi:hypothetical protein